MDNVISDVMEFVSAIEDELTNISDNEVSRVLTTVGALVSVAGMYAAGSDAFRGLMEDPINTFKISSEAAYKTVQELKDQEEGQVLPLVDPNLS